MKRSAFVFVLVALMAPILLALLPGTAAEAAPIFKNASVNILHSASLTTGGINVTVDYSCAPSGNNTTGTLFVNAAQSPNRGFGDTPATCDGKTRQATVFVAGTFSPGAANAFAEVENVDFSAFAQQTASITIK
jgi:hypothetical protein